MDAPYLSTVEAARYLGRSRRWLQDHRGEIGYCREPDGRISYRRSDLDAYKTRWYVPPPVEVEVTRHLPRRIAGSAGGINILTGMPYGTPASIALAAAAARPSTVSTQKKARERV